MLSITQLDPKQLKAFRFLITHKSSFLIADMGVGKTVVSLAAIKFLLDVGEIQKALVLAPLDVARLTWPGEVEEWEELRNLDWVLVRGTPKKRIELLKEKHQIYFLNYENFRWLGETYIEKHNNRKNPFQMVVFDESVKMASISNERFKKWKHKFKSFKYRIALTANPRPNTAETLYGQTYLLDSGETFAHNFEEWRTQYFYPVGKSGYIWKPFKDTNQRIFDKISHLTHRVEGKTRPYELTTITLSFPKNLQKDYDNLEKEFFLEVEQEEFVLPSKIVSLGKCCQFTGGLMYLDPEEGEKKKTYFIHDLKLKALGKLLESDQLKGRQVLIAYQYQHERDEICYRFPEVCRFDQGVKEENMKNWNDGAIRLMAIHPASAGHGLNLQYGGSDLIWYSIPHSKGQFDQTCGRINRQGQKEKVNVYQILVQNTVDMIKREVHRRRGYEESEFMGIVKRYQQLKG